MTNLAKLGRAWYSTWAMTLVASSLLRSVLFFSNCNCALRSSSGDPLGSMLFARRIWERSLVSVQSTTRSPDSSVPEERSFNLCNTFSMAKVVTLFYNESAGVLKKRASIYMSAGERAASVSTVGSARSRLGRRLGCSRRGEHRCVMHNKPKEGDKSAGGDRRSFSCTLATVSSCT